LPSDHGAIQLNHQAKEPEIDSETGLTVFDFASSEEISNESGAEFTLTVSPGELRADNLRDLYVLVNYRVAA
jgi:hypothetical protein